MQLKETSSFDVWTVDMRDSYTVDEVTFEQVKG